MTPETRAKISASVKAYWTPARRSKASRLARIEAARRKAFHILDAKLKPMRMAAWDECLANKWERCDIDRDCVGWDGEIWWGYWRSQMRSFEPPPPTEWEPDAQEWWAIQAEGARVLEHWRKVKGVT